MFHSILDSLLIFGALHTGDAPFGYLDWLRWFSYTVTGNVLGGLLLVTLLRLVRRRGPPGDRARRGLLRLLTGGDVTARYASSVAVTAATTGPAAAALGRRAGDRRPGR